MADKPSDLVQGTLDMLILKTLALEAMHGYGIAVRLEQMSKGFSASTQVHYLSPFSGCNERA
jgi:DNA-binding PadR family transcriptional regulator